MAHNPESSTSPRHGAGVPGSRAGHGDAAGHGYGVGHGHGAGHGQGLSHIMPMKVLLGVWATLVFLTWITVAATRVDLGGFNLWLAMGIATFKAVVVALYFMHLRYDRPINAIIFLGTLLFVGLFIGLTLIDTHHYRPDLIPGYSPAMPQ